VILEKLASVEYVAGWNHEAFCADRMSCCRQLGRQTDFSRIPHMSLSVVTGEVMELSDLPVAVKALAGAAGLPRRYCDRGSTPGSSPSLREP
jgi:hypothetical protein